MPLTGNFKQNVAELIAANKTKPQAKKRPMKQVAAIAYAQQKKK